MTSKTVEIVLPCHRQGNGISSAAIRWPDSGDRPSSGTPFGQIFAFRQTPPVVFTWPLIFPAYAGAGLRRRSSIRLRIFRNRSLGTATSANWNVTYRPCRTTFAPILTSFSRSVVNDQCCAVPGYGRVRCPHCRAKPPRFSRGSRAGRKPRSAQSALYGGRGDLHSRAAHRYRPGLAGVG